MRPDKSVHPQKGSLLGASWIVISRVKTRIAILTILITHIGGLIALLITTHEPPSSSRNRQRTVDEVSTLFWDDRVNASGGVLRAH